MWRRSATIGSIVDASLVIQETFGVLSDPECRAVMRASDTSTRSVASYRTSASNYRSELVTVPSLFVEETMLEIMSSDQG